MTYHHLISNQTFKERAKEYMPTWTSTVMLRAERTSVCCANQRKKQTKTDWIQSSINLMRSQSAIQPPTTTNDNGED